MMKRFNTLLILPGISLEQHYKTLLVQTLNAAQNGWRHKQMFLADMNTLFSLSI